MLRLSTVLLLLLFFTEVQAQRRLVAIDIETYEPVSNANVRTREGVLQTDSAGWVTIPDSCKTLVFSHVNYEERIVNLSELRDTVFLISKLLNIKEVVVFGIDKKRRDYSELNKRLKADKIEMQLAAADPSKAFSIGLGGLVKLLPRKWRPGNKKEQRKQKLKQILENY